MSLRKSINRIEYIDYLIRVKRTGTPKEFADKLNVSERWLYQLIKELKLDLNCPIKYSKRHRSYIYYKRGRVLVQFMHDEE